MGQWCVGGGGSGRSMAIRVPRLVVWHYGHEIISQPHRDKEKKGKNVRLDFRCWAEWSRALLSRLWRSVDGTRETRRWACQRAWQDLILSGETEQCATVVGSCPGLYRYLSKGSRPYPPEGQNQQFRGKMTFC